MTQVNRRGFLTAGAAGAIGAWPGVQALSAQAAGAQTPATPAKPAGGAEQAGAGAKDAGPGGPGSDIPYGKTKLGLSDDMRDGALYVPKSYRDDTPMPAMVMLHGYSGWGDEMRSMFELAEEFGVIIVAPDSRDVTWGRSAPGFDQDVRFIGSAFRYAGSQVNIDPARVALGGRSDGAGYALSMGLAYGDTFNHLIVIAGGMMAPVRRQGKPKVFMAHGVDDRQMPIDRTGRLFSKQLQDEGYDVTYREYDGGHATPVYVVRDAFVWLVGRDPKKAPGR